MSVAAQSPHRGSKRHFERNDSPEHYSHDRSFSPSHKRFRPLTSRSTPLAERQPYVVTSTTIQALKGLFPDMDDKTIGDVLEACGNNIDVAIKQLGQLRLTARAGAAPVQPAADAAPANAVQAPANPQNAGQQTTASQGSATLQESAKPSTPEEWVEALVQQMAGARDMADARQRAASFLQSFEQTVLQTAGKQDDPAASALRAQLAELQHNNGILKRAVAIQNNRIQDLSAKDSDSQRLKQLVVQLQEKCHGLEMNNYSLAMHLKQATDSAPHSQQRHPDVY